jgi:hypothetical protein
MTETEIDDAVLLALWRKGCDTKSIAQATGLRECEVYARLPLIRHGHKRNIDLLGRGV